MTIKLTPVTALGLVQIADGVFPDFFHSAWNVMSNVTGTVADMMWDITEGASIESMFHWVQDTVHEGSDKCALHPKGCTFPFSLASDPSRNYDQCLLSDYEYWCSPDGGQTKVLCPTSKDIGECLHTNV